MIVIRVLFKIQASASQTFASLIQEDLSTTRQMPGCRHFGLFADPSEPHTYLLYEEWESLADFEAYKQSEAFQANSAKIFPLMDGKPSSAYFQAEILEEH